MHFVFIIAIAIAINLVGHRLHTVWKNRRDEKTGYDGTLTLVPIEDGTTITLSVDPDDLVGKSTVTFKVASEEKIPLVLLK